MINKSLYIGLLIFGFVIHRTFAQHTIKLWDGQEKPYYKENSLSEYEKEAWGTKCVYDIIEPTLTIYPARDGKTNKAVLIMPGGGYSLVAMYHEGYDVAELLSAQGITVAVLKYRLPNPKSSDQPDQVPITDARRALKMLKSLSSTYGFDPSKVGVMGFSAGSHLATAASLWKSGDSNENPNFSILVYGVTNPSDANYKWLEESLYYRTMSAEERSQNDMVSLINEDTPPTFLVHAYDDDICPVSESTLYAERLKEVGVPVEMHLFDKGGHGFGVGRQEDGTDQWISLCINWVKRL